MIQFFNRGLTLIFTDFCFPLISSCLKPTPAAIHITANKQRDSRTCLFAFLKKEIEAIMPISQITKLLANGAATRWQG
jgi:hypothetical protein